MYWVLRNFETDFGGVYFSEHFCTAVICYIHTRHTRVQGRKYKYCQKVIIILTKNTMFTVVYL